MQSESEIINSFVNEETLLKYRGEHRKQNNMNPESDDKALISLLLGYLNCGSQKMGSEVAGMISTVIFDILSFLQSQEDISSAVKNLYNKFDPNHPDRFFSSCTETQNKLFPDDNAESLSEQLQNEYAEDLKMLETNNSKSNKIIIAIDSTHEPADSIYKNGEFADVVIGQQQTWTKGFQYEAAMDVTNGLFIDVKRHKKHIYSGKELPLPHGIPLIMDSIRAAEQLNTEVGYILADRGYYDARFFAYAYFTLYNQPKKGVAPIRFIVPKKYTRDKEQKKREIYEDPNYPEIKLSSIQLNAYCEPALKELCKFFKVPYLDGYFFIPMVEVVCIGLWDDDERMSFSKAKQYYADLKEKEAQAKIDLQSIEFEYLQHLKDIGYTCKNVPKTINRRGKTKFHTTRQRRLYNRYIQKKNHLKSIQDKITELHTKTAVICVSISINEEFHQYNFDWRYDAQLYRYRWSIENGFRDIKQHFWIKKKSRKPSKRFSRLIMGIRLYNRWHIARMQLMLRKIRRKNPRSIPFDPKKRYIRRKIEKIYGHLLPAKTFLSQMVHSCINSRLKNGLYGLN